MSNEDRILIVEDEEDSRFIYERLLTKSGYNVKTANNGDEALEIISEFKPKIILADWTMPKLNGIELCNIIKKKEEFKLIYFILLTARTSLKDRVEGLDTGADDYLVKPIDNQELVARIRSGIRIHNLQNELKNIEHNKAVVELACTIGHQINNPLSSLKLSINSLKDEIDNKKDGIEEDLYVIDESLKRIQEFVKALQKLQSAEIMDYALDNKMLKI
ncbi:MAG: response regulator [Ignavibacteriae bacterium]|nr:response regulator [Ignavibacteriota bacterium]MCB9206081.1 response regulator [Ignavibacteriales bacterium]MCB9209354.1 response regulator [Ignavibacteriales bacterium]MCB9257997.1 response regulator [Ignavibacteriales bacterium]